MDCYNSYLEIDCHRLWNNIQAIRADIGEDKALIPVLKCDAYGMGALPLAKDMAKLPYIRRFALAQVREALQLRAGGISQALMVMGGIPEAHIIPALKADVELTVYSLPMAKAVMAAAKKLGKPAHIHVKVETGLNRLGLKPGEEMDEIISLIKSGPWLKLASLYSHFVDSEIMGSRQAPLQLARYVEALRQFEAAGLDVPLRHLCNSSASEGYREALLDGARIGRRLYMDSQRHPKQPGSPGAIQDVASWRSEIISLRLIKAGESVGYDGAFTAKTPTLVATIPLGYGDGLDERLLAAEAPLLITKEGHEARYIAICMDQSLVDVSGIDCHVGDEITLMGRASGGKLLSAQALNARIRHEGAYLLSRIGPRVKRVYINQTK